MLSTTASYQLIANNLPRWLDQTARKPEVARDTAFYLQNIGKVTTIDQFLNDYRLFSYAMKAFGLSDMVYAKAFMRKVLAEGTSSKDAFANKLVDTRYREFAAAFDFARLGGSATHTTAAQTGTVQKFVRQTLEGAQNDGVRLALYFERKASGITNAFSILADPALLETARTALGISATTAMADVDKQAAMLSARLNFADFHDPVKLHKFLQRFTAMWEAQNSQAAASIPSISISQPSTSGISTDTLMTLQTLKIGK